MRHISKRHLLEYLTALLFLGIIILNLFFVAKLESQGKEAVTIVPTSPIVVEGKPGDRGPVGFDGQSGRDGTDGADGAMGATGAPGPAGADGKDGVDGQQGSDGLDGSPGPIGMTGADGAAGTPGTNGEPPVSWKFSWMNQDYTCTRTDPFDPNAPTYRCEQDEEPV